MGGTILVELYHPFEHERAAWVQNLSKLLPKHEILSFSIHHNDISKHKAIDLAKVEYAVTWRTPFHILAEMPRLRAVLLCGAGADHLMPFDALPSHVPIVRLVDQEVAQDMALYALHWVLHFHLSFNTYLQNQTIRLWAKCAPSSSRKEFCVGVLGFGNVGMAVCRAMSSAGYRVIACGRSSREAEDIQCYSVHELESFLSECNALVNVLPLTSHTENLLNLSRFMKLRKGAIFICMGRGATFVESALCNALETGHLKAAVLDTLREEPLSSNSPLWDQKQVVITPHISGVTVARSSTEYIAENIKRIERGEQPFPVIDRLLQY